MKIASVLCLFAAGLPAIAVVFACGDNNPTRPSTSGSSSASSSGANGSGGGSGSGGLSSGGQAMDGGAGSDASVCPSGLQDKVTSCMATDPTCVKGCGPDMAGGVNNNLGYKTCSCNTGTMVYTCQACVYPQPLPSCYSAGPAPAACAAGVANKAACAAACNGVCTIVSDAGKTQGCVCVTNSAGATQYTCATQWW